MGFVQQMAIIDHGHNKQKVDENRHKEDDYSKAGLNSSDRFKHSFKQSRAVLFTFSEVTDQRHSEQSLKNDTVTRI